MSISRRSFITALTAALACCGMRRGKRPHVLLKSSWQTVNIGDIAHTPGMLALLAEHLPDVDVTLWPRNIADDGVEAMLNRHFPALNVVQSDEDLKHAFEQCDFLLHGSGPSLIGHRNVAQWWQATGKPWGVIGITISKEQAAEAKIRALFDAARFAYFRDSISAGVAKDAGFECPIGFAPDATFAISIRDEEKAAELLRQHQLQAGRFICVIPKLRHTQYWLIHGRAMTEAEAAFHATNERLKEHDHAMIRAAVIEFVRSTQMKVLLCPEDKSHVAIAREMIFEKLPDDVKPSIAQVGRYWLTDEAVAVYAKALALLSVDMHSPIMALAQGTPAIVCRFEQQTSKGQMWADIGLRDWLFDLDVERDGGRITDALMSIVDHRDAARAKARQAIEVVKEHHRTAMATLAEHLKQSSRV